MSVVTERETPISIRVGSLSAKEATAAISGGTVAEKNSVWRFAGHFWMIRFTSWMNPMSSMRSTSSRMRIWMPPSLSSPSCRKSMRRPGVATTMSVPARSSLRWRP